MADSQVEGLIQQVKISNSIYNLASTAYGVCDTLADEPVKLVSMPGFELKVGVTVHIKFTYNNTASNPQLNIATTGAKPIVQYGTTAVANSDSTSGWYAGAVVSFTYDGTSWVRDQGFNTNTTYSYMRPYGSTGSSTAAKVGTAGWKFQLSAGKYFMFTQYYDNTAQSALTLNIGSTGAKPIYINGSPSSASNYTLPGGQYLVYYDGTNYHFRTDDKIPGNIAGDAATVNGLTVKTAVPANAVFTDTNKYHKSGSWSGLTYTATAVNSADELKFTIPDNYGDTKNPYASKTKNYVLAAPSTANGVPSFRALVAADIPDISATYLKRTGGAMSGDISFSNTGAWPAAEDEVYPLKSKGLTWGGTSDKFNLYYRVDASNEGNLVFESSDDGNEKIIFRTTKANGDFAAINSDIRTFYPINNNTGSIGTADNKWANIYATNFYGDLTSSYSKINLLQTGHYYHNVAEFQCTNTPKEILIKTRIPFTNGNSMPKILIHMYNYNNFAPTELGIVFYIYGNVFTNYGVTSNTSHRPKVTLSSYTENGNTYVAIGLGLIGTQEYTDAYYVRFNVDLLDLWQNEHNYSKNWTIESNTTTTSIIPTNNRVTLEYKDRAQHAYTATNVTGTVAIANGGTGKTTAAEAWTALGGGASGKHDDSYFAKASHNHAASDINSGTFDVARIPNLSWNKITSDKPTTLSGYGITDAKIASGTITLGSNTISPVTAITWDSTNKKLTRTINGAAADVVTAATLRTDLGLSNALHFIGITSTILADGSTTSTLTAKSTGSLTKTTGFVDGDVVMDGDQLREYVWSGSTWRLLGITTSTAYSKTTTGNTFISSISQGTDGKVTADSRALDTSGTWSGTATTATNLASNPSMQTSNTTQVTITAGGKTSSAYTIPYATIATYISCPDTRDETIDPQSMKSSTGVRFDFKSSTVTGLSGYSGVMSFRSYPDITGGDWSGGPAHQLAFNASGDLYHRISTGNTSWGNWYTLLDTNNLNSVAGIEIIRL